jgi:hypothetical protein
LSVPDLRLILIAGVILLACVVAWALSKRSGGPMLTQTLPKMKGSLDASARARRVDVAVGREILEMLETGRRAEAVALVRERTGLDAEEADAAVLKLENLRKRLES